MTHAVLFDVDGTLVDSTYPHTLAWWQAFRRADLDVPMWRLHRCIGMGPDQLVPAVTDADVDVDALAESHDAIYSTFWPSLRALPGARDLVRRCHDSGLVTVLASSAGSREVQVIRGLLDCDDALDHATSSDDADDSKPAPDLVSVAVRRAGVDAAEVVFVGDAVWDVHACVEAGVTCIGLECGGTSAAELEEAGAAAVFRDPADLLARIGSSPLGTSQGEPVASPSRVTT
ncbi:HAD family hydrolase [Jatrophihabitans endophyticus]|uniref:HAD family hydrolase n=1 Tax=Jatrophihabitans endophyticus TaxID=1206085 RepID=UPI001A006A01|nr:HAD family hydrolase [Jatrophihabitans endophyticus]MBE7187439.1 HAD family hydrolase [Jatrophihabitans endophyticus]